MCPEPLFAVNTLSDPKTHPFLRQAAQSRGLLPSFASLDLRMADSSMTGRPSTLRFVESASVCRGRWLRGVIWGLERLHARQLRRPGRRLPPRRPGLVPHKHKHSSFARRGTHLGGGRSCADACPALLSRAGEAALLPRLARPQAAHHRQRPAPAPHGLHYAREPPRPPACALSPASRPPPRRDAEA